jgi:hypothetical protein
MPPPIDDPVLGRLEWDGDDALVGEIAYHPDQLVSMFLTFDPEESENLDEILARARLALERFRVREREYRLWSAGQLQHSRWNNDEPMSDMDIANLLLVASFDFTSEGGVRVYWNDADILFAGHNVITEIGPDGECVDVGMQ